MINNITTFPMYSKFLNDVIQWNIAAGNLNFTSEQLNLQKMVTLEELRETLEASQNNNTKELIDGVIDTFVTLGYLIYLIDQNPTPFYENEEIDIQDSFAPDMRQSAFEEVLEVYINKLENPEAGDKFHHEDILFMIIYVANLEETANPGRGLSLMEQYFQDVVDSNNSKFIAVVDYQENEEDILAFANEQYKDKFENIRAVPAILNGQPVYVLRADYGSGKILKPNTYRAPAFNS